MAVPHGASHQRVATALRKALCDIQPQPIVEVVNALDHCPRWFRYYYNSYGLFLALCPALWARIENLQHHHTTTGPDWLYRRAGRYLYKFIQGYDPDIVIATEVGMCELAAILKRELRVGFRLVGAVTGMDADRAWSQPEVDLYAVAPGEAVAQLEAAGVPRHKILACGQPVDPVFTALPDRHRARIRLEVEHGIPLLLVLFGGAGVGSPRHVVAELKKVEQPHQAVFIAGRNRRLREEVASLCSDRPHYRALGWVDNIHEWMVVADLLVSKPGASTMIESFNCGLPLLALDPLPGNEQRACEWIEKTGVGYWVKRRADLAPLIGRLLPDREELRRLRERALALARPNAAYDAAEAIMQLSSHPDKYAISELHS